MHVKHASVKGFVVGGGGDGVSRKRVCPLTPRPSLQGQNSMTMTGSICVPIHVSRTTFHEVPKSSYSAATILTFLTEANPDRQEDFSTKRDPHFSVRANICGGQKQHFQNT